MIYAISDIHGEYDLFRKMLKKINFSDNDTMYILGDAIDRGLEPIKTLKYIMEHKNIVLLRGNHEAMMLDYFDSDYNDTTWLYNGGSITYEKLVELGEGEARKIPLYVRKCPLTIDLSVDSQVYRLVHAGLDYYNGAIRVEQSIDFILWARNEFLNCTDIDEDIVVFGHTPTSYMGSKDKIWHGENKIGIDCGATFCGTLGCLRLDDMKEFYVNNN